MTLSGSNSTPRLVKRQAPPAPVAAPIVPPTPKPKKKPRSERESLLPGQAAADVFPYWMVWARHRQWMPIYRHPTPESAHAEASRIAALNPGKPIFVVRIEAVQVSDPPTP